VTVILADAIDFPLLFVVGLGSLVPLLLFEVAVESLVLGRVWNLRARELFRLTLGANIVSLIAGIPTKLVNAVLYGLFLPQVFPDFAIRYPYLATVGTLIYFLVTLVAEGMCAAKWVRHRTLNLSSGQIWKGMFWANVATYAVVAPLHYYVTRPASDVREYTSNARWAKHRDTRIVFVDPNSGHLKTKLLGDETVETVVPEAMREYVVSTNLTLCLYRSVDDHLCLWRREPPLSVVVVTSSVPIGVERAAFSPDGNRVAYVPEGGAEVEVFDVVSQRRQSGKFATALSGYCRVVWMSVEESFVVTGENGGKSWLCTVSSNRLTLEAVSPRIHHELLPCYSRMGHGNAAGSEWGSVVNFDECDGLSAWAHPAVGTARISVRNHDGRERSFKVAANPGLFHWPFINFSEAAYLDDCSECLIGGSQQLYLLDLQSGRLGVVARGRNVVPLTPRFLRTLPRTK
jgi:hypothetical protein